MRRVFADTQYFLALLNAKDEGHAAAVEFSLEFIGILVTTEWVLVELADALASTRARDLFSVMREKFRKNPSGSLIPLDIADLEEGIALFATRPDKEWSLTDCISFVVMRREKIAEAATADRHFEQAGFTALLKDDATA